MDDLKPVTYRRFYKYVGITSFQKCWIWNGKRDKDGYGLFRHEGEWRRAHRIAFSLSYLTSHPVVMHICDNTACCNPLHLRGGTQSQNMKDKVRKDRQAKGSRNGRAKLTEMDVKSIKWELFWNYGSQAEIARRYRVSKSVIRDIKREKTWKHVNKIDLEDIRVEPVQ